MPWQDFLPLAPIVGDIAGTIVDRAQSRKDIERQNAYNTPAAQVARLRKAGLPMAAMGGNIANTQSALPQTSGSGIAASGGRIANFITSQTQLQQLEILKEEVRLKRSERLKNEAEVTYLLEGAGEDRQNTNLTRNLKTQFGASEADLFGKRITNKLQEVAANNAEFKTEQENKAAVLGNERAQLENQKIVQDIMSIIQNRDMVAKNIEGKELENKILAVKESYQSRMSDAEFKQLLLSNDIKANEKDLGALRYKFEKGTYGLNYAQKWQDLLTSELSYKRIGAEFDTYNRYQQFVTEAQKIFQADETNFNPIKLGERLAALFYTMTSGITGASGQGGGVGELLRGIK